MNKLTKNTDQTLKKKSFLGLLYIAIVHLSYSYSNNYNQQRFTKQNSIWVTLFSNKI